MRYALTCSFMILAVAACSTEQAATSVQGDGKPAGQIKLAVGTDVRPVGLAEATCKVVNKGGTPYLNVYARAADKHQVDDQPVIPYVLSARLPADLGKDEVTFGPEDATFGAAASIVGAEYDGEEYNLLQVIARKMRDGPTDYECRASRDGQAITVVCNNAMVWPWTAPGEVPGGSFRATVSCGG